MLDTKDLRLEGGAAADEEVWSSSGSRDLFRPPRAAGGPRFAADMFGRRGELELYVNLARRVWHYHLGS